MKKHFRIGSMKAQVTLVYAMGILVMTFLILAICRGSMNELLTVSASRELNLIADNFADQVNMTFAGIEDTVNSVSLVIPTQVDQVQDLYDNENRKNLLNTVEWIFAALGNANPRVRTLYFRFSMEITKGEEEGFFYTSERGEKLKKTELTQIQDFDVPESEEDIDMEHVGWYYLPMFRKTPMWMEPYYNMNIDLYMISFVVPIFIEDTFIGIAGMDVDFQKLLEEAQNFKVLKSGYAYLKSADGMIHYHPEDSPLEEDHHGDKEIGIEIPAALTEAEDSGEKIIRYEYAGRDRVMAFTTLRNGMKLVVCDDYQELFEERDNLIHRILRVVLISAVILTLVGYIFMKRLTAPLEKLTEAAHEIEKGNYDPELPQSSSIELDALTNALKYMAIGIDQQDMAMKNLAFVDSLTSVKNKTAYDASVRSLDAQIQTGKAQFTVVMSDLNYLKRINDSLGHRAGDNAIRSAAGILCRTFPLSTVFRIGGDEFVVILTGVEYERREELLAELRRKQKVQEDTFENILERVSLSTGWADFDPARDRSYKSVFERADRAMYEEKHRIHEEDGMTDRKGL